LRLVGLAEVAVAAALLAPPLHPLDGAAAALLSAGFLGYLAYASVAAPTTSCGCLGTHSQPVDVRAFARAAFLLVASVVALLASSAAAAPVPAVVVVEAVLLMALSSELDRHWLTPLRAHLVRVRRPLAAPPSARVPLETSLHLLRRSPAFCSASDQLTSDVQETWDEEGLRFVVYGASGRTAIFAVPLTGDDPEAVRVALVDA
ncbi:MauE/DoxX family redox-associated membrane protein, partial [Nonomuraea antimicrobica]|uniref:MauE/DoxX family redox-associated membrane protein n=1 Tax=Nonomuraea antimicrobica TaxID=561173 RepID=UPI0031EA3226